MSSDQHQDRVPQFSIPQRIALLVPILAGIAPIALLVFFGTQYLTGVWYLAGILVAIPFPLAGFHMSLLIADGWIARQ